MEILTDKVIYHTKTQEDYDDLIRRLKKLGCEWFDYTVCTSVNYFLGYGENTAIRVEDKKINYSHLSYYLNELNTTYKDHQIIKYKKEQNSMIVKLKADQRFIADWYVESKNTFEFSVYCLLSDYRLLSSKEFIFKHGGKMLDWTCDNKNEPVQTLVKMHLFGYEIEQEKLYTVEIPNPNNIGNEFLVLMRNGFNQIVALTKSGEKWRNQNAFQLTENEIKKDFAWAWDFAKQV